MTQEELAEWATEFEAFHARFARFFRRSEPRQQASRYLRGLMASVQRKNGWQLAEAVGDSDPQKMQRLLYSAHWDADAVRDELQRFVIEHFSDPEGIGVVDDSGFLKKGEKSVGVKRQYSGPAGKIENCQIGVFLTYQTTGGHTFLDRRLYLPEEWCMDWERRQAAGVPEAVTFQTKPALAIAMLQHAWAQGMPMRWVTGDESYGDVVAVRQAIEETQRWYVLAVSCSTPVWEDAPRVVTPFQPAKGRPRTRPRLTPGAPPWTTVAAVVAAWPASRWQRLSVVEGEKGLRTYDWGCQRISEGRDSLPGPDAWLIARRSLSNPQEIAYYLSNAPHDMPLERLAQIASARWSIEQCLEEGKGETGLDEYEVRSWPSWHRHITLSLMAHAWLAALRREAAFPPTRLALGGTDRAGSAATPGSSVAAARAFPRPASCLVPLASPQATTSAAQSLSQTRRTLSV